jgi:hypothetical protein
MEERVEGELGTAGEVVALGTPGYLLSRNGGGGRNVFFEERGRRKEEGDMFRGRLRGRLRSRLR